MKRKIITHGEYVSVGHVVGHGEKFYKVDSIQSVYVQSNGSVAVQFTGTESEHSQNEVEEENGKMARILSLPICNHPPGLIACEYCGENLSMKA